ncbi:MAG TPA: tRNA 2-thiouridine(34) synthase MnmA [Candidatus Pacearchaeota archaeon]|nr:tRNA 2-thiouridine(34) synthase MnmA [Candidatus Pacearchaeota archaeon]HPO75329.1 tRNA 2-thiouridine(34) synthase MnmA [Candidatus Pacearchaeota archaeon]
MKQNKQDKKNQKVIIAMSGGIDSSVAAALLKQKGFEVIGAFMNLWEEDKKKSIEAKERARKVAKILEIPFCVFDLEKEFKEKIVNYFLEDYKKGITPNPCVLCNKEIKFGLFAKRAFALGADFVATGHYARIRKFVNSKQIRYSLISSKDKNKDQSYFLWMLNQEQLRRVLFPVGNYTKQEAKKLAKKFKLPVFDAPESEEICFVQGALKSENNLSAINDFLKRYLKPKPGKIVDQEGNVLGRHEDLCFYTIGQRKGIKLPQGPFFVLDKDPKRNFLIVTKDEKDLYKNELVAENINWISGKAPKPPFKAKAKIRYRHEAAEAEINKFQKGKIKVIFKTPQRAITPGQSVVFYKGGEVLGGGTIV